MRPMIAVRRQRPLAVRIAEYFLVGVALAGGTLVLATRFGLAFPIQDRRCLPYSAYLVIWDGQAPEPGEFVVFRTDQRVKPIYPAGVDFVKKVVAGGGSAYRVRADGEVLVNGEVLGHMEKDVLKELEVPPEALARTGQVPKGGVFAIGTLPGTYDSRYWGPVRREQIRGRAIPLF